MSKKVSKSSFSGWKKWGTTHFSENKKWVKTQKMHEIKGFLNEVEDSQKSFCAILP